MASTQLALRYGCNTKPSTLLNSLFMTTVNTAARSLLAVANTDNTGSWKLMDHAKYMFMLTTWTTVWFLKVLVDHFPISIGSNLSNSPFLVEGISSVGSSILNHLASFSSSSKSYASTSSAASSLDLVLYQGSDDVLPEKFLGGSLSHILAMLNELPASTRKYQFAVAMADRIVDEGARDGDAELYQLNRVALASAFASTSNLLYCSLSKRSNTTMEGFSGTWSARIIGSLPFGSVLVKGLGAVLPLFSSGGGMRRQPLALESAYDDHVMAEKHVQELLWLTNKMRFAGVVDEALLQWSFATGLSSISLTANPRVQGFIVKISAILFGELARGNLEAPDQVKFRLLALWLPLFCFAENGLSYPILTNYEKAEMERILNQIISTLSLADQHVILTNWMQDFLHSTSDWPNLQLSFDRYCQSCRKVIKSDKVNMEKFDLIE